MHTPVRSNTPSTIHTNNDNNNNNDTNTHKEKHKENYKEYGEEDYTTMCTQCKRILVLSSSSSSSSSDDKSDVPLRISNEDGTWINVDYLPDEHSTISLSHGLCRTCFNSINTSLLSSASPSSSCSSPSSSPSQSPSPSHYYHSTSAPASLESVPPSPSSSCSSSSTSPSSTSSSLSSSPSSSSLRSILSKSLSSPQLSRHLPSRPKRVLIVDDNKLQRQIHKRMIEHLGYECDAAENGEEGLKLIEKHSYSFILMDLIMSPMDGWTTSKKIKSSLLLSLGFSSSFPKIIAVTGLNVDEKLVKQCNAAGMEEVLHKPISTVMLNKVLHKHSSTPRKLDR